MTDFTCINCWSNQIQNIQKIIESETEAIYINEQTSSKEPSFDEIVKSSDQIKINSQTRLAYQLSNLDIPDETSLVNPVEKEQLINSKKKQEKRLNYLKSIKTNNDNLNYDMNNFFKYLLIIVGITCLFLALVGLVVMIIIGSDYPFLFLISYLFFISLLSELGIILFYFALSVLIQFLNYLNNKKLVKEIQSIKQSIDQLTQQIIELEDANDFNKKLHIWSNLYYCHDCNTVMELETKIHNTPEKINDLVNELYYNSYFR
ncbi:hypothetical protein FRE64_02040 [Euhalothece natronophila Z-M001]|uniref:Transmembrane protein n=1 Tax=Euhalothece natronophila Z-M001 TaxID=522448 RepID=A0A5B8NJW8_9CHRO|nr:hypothetical protein [Euhalothece natronophila]QDZ38821.1 hypothetical protein FRE64_02040 [Euhalothece natronophila Z-M001]